MESIGLYSVFALMAVINATAFIVVGYDKKKSIDGHGDERIPEGVLFFLATVFGSVGVFAGMQTFRHKTRKWYFQIGIPLLMVQNLVTTFFLLDLIAIQ